MRRSRVALLSAGIIAAGVLVSIPATGHAGDTAKVTMPGLRSAASVVRDIDGVAHIKAANTHDLFFMQGYVHAGSRSRGSPTPRTGATSWCCPASLRR